MSNILEIRDLVVNFGGIGAVGGISLDVEEGKIVTLIGANGAGKSTILRAVSGIVRPKSGSIKFCGDELTGLTPDRIVAKGVTLVPEGRRVFPNLTVLENLRIGAYLRHDSLSDDIEYVYSLFPRLGERSWQLAGTLSGGEQQMLAIGRGIMAKPKLMMLDEPSLGLAPVIVTQVFDIIKEINQEGMAIMLIEQNAQKVLEFCDQAYIMQVGKVAISGKGRDLLEDNAVAAAYLGD